MIYWSTIFCNNFDSFCPFYWASSLLCVWIVWTPLSMIRAMPEKPTVVTTTPKTKPMIRLRIQFPLDKAHAIELGLAVFVSFDGAHDCVMCSHIDILFEAEKYSMILFGNSSYKIHVPVLAKRYSDHFNVQHHFVAN